MKVTSKVALLQHMVIRRLIHTKFSIFDLILAKFFDFFDICFGVKQVFFVARLDSKRFGKCRLIFDNDLKSLNFKDALKTLIVLNELVRSLVKELEFNCCI